ncbi:hypothetical protein Tco_0845909 [Tanacetum coccineum]
MVIEEPEYGLFFIGYFGDQAFQIISDINKRGFDTLVTYLVMASNINTPENQRFCSKLRKLIDPDQDKLKSKRVKFEAVGCLQDAQPESTRKTLALSEAVLRFGVKSSSSKESDNSSGNTNSTESLYPNFQKAKGFHALPPPTGTVIPPRANVSFTRIDELAIRNKVVNQENTKSSQPEIDRNKVIIEDWVDSDDEETALNFSETQKKTVLNS